MAGLAELLLGKSNPFSQFISENQNKVSAAFGGLGSGTNFSEGLSRAAQGAALASPLDQAAAEKRQLANDSITARNKTAAYLRNQPGGAQFADAIENGNIDGSTAFKSWLDASKGQAPQNPYMSAGDGQFFNWQTGQYVTNPNAPPDTPNLPTSFQEFQLAQENPEYAATLNSSTSRPLTEGQRRNQQLGSVVEPLVNTVVENWSELTDPKNQSIGFDTPIGAPGYALTSPGYQKATNALKTIAQSYLYSVSGAAATDAETKKIVDSVTPKFGESEASANEKKALLARYVQAIVDAGGGGGQAAGGGMPTVADKATYDALPPGTRYLAPDGTTRTKP